MRKLKQIENVGGDAYTDPKKGITLIALVITIIVLLILAGITISLTVGQRGILTRAQEAGKNYQESAKKEDDELTNFLGEVDNIINGVIDNGPVNPEENEDTDPNWTEAYKTTIKDNYEDNIGRKATIPEGFQVSKKAGETRIDEGLVVRDATTQNEYVWVPCTENGENETIKYDRYAFSKEGWTYTQTKNEETGEITIKGNTKIYTEDKPSEELNSIKKYGGFYIGRYEVGIQDGIQELTGYDEENNTTPNKEWTGWKNGKVVVQKDKQVWNYITRDKAKNLAEGMYENNNVVTSRLCSSYAWDTTLQFIGGDYAVNSTGDNYSGKLNNTGENSTARKNIYDMGGNVGEWTTEDYSSTTYPYTRRGGDYRVYTSDGPAGFRIDVRENVAFEYQGFRLALFIGL